MENLFSWNLQILCARGPACMDGHIMERKLQTCLAILHIDSVSHLELLLFPISHYWSPVDRKSMRASHNFHPQSVEPVKLTVWQLLG